MSLSIPVRSQASQNFRPYTPRMRRNARFMKTDKQFNRVQTDPPHAFPVFRQVLEYDVMLKIKLVHEPAKCCIVQQLLGKWDYNDRSDNVEFDHKVRPRFPKSF
jgi:hypothetical protein